jgi:hypothetical protein
MFENINKLELWVTSLSDTPRLQYYDVQTLEYRYISKLPMKNERIWQSVLLMEKTSNLSQVADKLYHIMLYQVHATWMGFELTTLLVVGTDCTGSCKSNYHMITVL